ncbi:alkaline phosphatase D family protein [Rhodococcus sp. X156]|uniref:alkaline phosphatase D family protein n=1 Tax=Rhodococcus sp. X156 TaxID=2499145 RepID=UPI000FDA24D4|nr:alkaline phosphatase D family protein [Rhodococcus sp. X156]
MNHDEQNTDEQTTDVAAERAGIVLGPLLRFVDDHQATVWVETDTAVQVTVECDGVRRTEPTWSLHGHHYALVVLDGLPADAELPYTVSLDDQQVWPLPGAPASLVRTTSDEESVRLAFGSCRRGEGHTPDQLAALGADALVAMALRMQELDHAQWPDALLLVGDQVYADDPSEAILEKLHARRAAGEGPPGVDAGGEEVVDEICDFEEYTWLYHESWGSEHVRWLLSTLPTCMILDDHDLRDDWNSSWSWRQQIITEPWWRSRVIGAFSSYWVYQHLGNLSPTELAEDKLYQAVREAPGDAERVQLLADFAWRADTEPQSMQWSYHRDFGRNRLVVLDSRCSRRLDPANRAMMDTAEWEWARQQALQPLPSGKPVQHLLIGSTLPFLMLPGLHHLEGWNEATAQGAWGKLGSKVGEKIRLAVDLEHWAAFRQSFDDMVALVADVAHLPEPPASVLWLSGDVHCSYLAEAQVQDVEPRDTAVHQLTMSPFRNPLNKPIQVVNKLVKRPAVAGTLRLLARAAGVRDPAIRWDVQGGPWFDNGVMTVVLKGRKASVEVEHASVDEQGRQVLQRTLVRRLA